MRDLSEKELLLLSNYLYVDRSAKFGTIGDMLDEFRNESGTITAEKLGDLNIGGCMSAEECADIFREMDACPDDFKKLCAVRVIDDGGIRGVCFANPDDSSGATVVFRGTGGSYEAWADDFRGEYMKATDMQKLADDFVRYDCGVYENITVAGHSKGGNMAQFVTVTNRDRVKACVSFDGQGFGKDSLSAYGVKMKDSSHRIKSISGDKDYVNIMLNPIASTREYVSIDAGGKSLSEMAVDFHSSYVLYKSCNFDETGRIINLSRQSLIMTGIADSLKRLVNGLDFLPGDGNRKATELLGALVSAGLTDDIGDEKEHLKIEEAIDGIKKYLADLSGLWNTSYKGGVPVAYESVYFDAGIMTESVAQLREACCGVEEVMDAVSELKYKLNYKAASRLAVETLLKKQEKSLKSSAKRIAKHADTLEAVCNLYRGCEESLCSEIAGTAFN